MLRVISHCKGEHDCTPQITCTCGEILKTYSSLRKHHIIHNADPAFYCKICKQHFGYQSVYDSHVEAKHGPNAEKFICEICSKEFIERYKLVSHQRLHLPESERKVFSCDLCGKTYSWKFCVQNHMEAFHKKLYIHTCEICGKIFNTQASLRNHSFVHSKVRNYHCSFCASSFKCKSSLRIHERSHKEKRIECPICKCNFHTQSLLNNHMISHTDQKSYECKICEKSYKRLKDLKGHMNFHTGKRPYSCNWCDRTFVDGSNCRKHKLRNHPDELAEYEAKFGKGCARIHKKSGENLVENP